MVLCLWLLLACLSSHQTGSLQDLKLFYSPTFPQCLAECLVYHNSPGKVCWRNEHVTSKWINAEGFHLILTTDEPYERQDPLWVSISPFIKRDKIRQWFPYSDWPRYPKSHKKFSKNKIFLKLIPGDSDSPGLEWSPKICLFKKVSHMQPVLWTIEPQGLKLNWGRLGRWCGERRKGKKVGEAVFREWEQPFLIPSTVPKPASLVSTNFGPINPSMKWSTFSLSLAHRIFTTTKVHLMNEEIEDQRAKASAHHCTALSGRATYPKCLWQQPLRRPMAEAIG